VLTVISGSFSIGMVRNSTKGGAHAGSCVVLPAGMAHFADSIRDCVVQIDGEGPFQINYVNPADDPWDQRSKRCKDRYFIAER